MIHSPHSFAYSLTKKQIEDTTAASLFQAFSRFHLHFCNFNGYHGHMKTLRLLFLLLTVAAMTLTGCGKPNPKTSSAPPEKGTLQTAVEGFTGKTAVDYGLKAKEQIKKINEKEIQDRNEAMQ